jgi:hypothetical protein
MLWTDVEGRAFGRFTCGQLVRPEGRTAWFRATDANGQPQMVSVTETLNDDDDLMARLRAAAKIHHQNVVEIREAMAMSLDDTPVVIAVMEPTEENLADVLRERTLSMIEGQAVLEALIQGLAAMHSRGLVHGRMEAASVLAMGETIKLRSDCLQTPGPRFATGAAENVRALGRIVTHAVTRRVPAGENDPVLQLLPDPMARAVRRALSGTAPIEEIASLAGVRIVAPARAADPGPVALRGPLTVEAKSIGVLPISEFPRGPASAASPVAGRSPGPTAKAPPSTQAAPSEAEKSAARAIPVAEPDAAPAPAGPALPPRFSTRPRASSDEPQRVRRASTPWVLGAAALILLATIIALYALVHRDSRAVSGHPVGAVPVAGPAASPGTRPLPASSSTASAVVLASPGWRVVAYTYNHEAQAEHKAVTIRQRYPQLAPGVFAPRRGAPYLVTLGSVMNKGDALALRNQAVRMGLPRDTYAQNYR